MKQRKKRLALLTSGGDAPGMNAAVRSCIRTALSESCDITGIMRGYSGLLEEDMHDLDTRSAGGIVYLGGTVLKTARCPAFMKDEFRRRAADILKKHQIDGLIVIGGDGSMAGAAELSALGISTVTIPGTIDNDMNGTDYTVGYDTAVNTALEAVRKIRDTASSHDRAALVEVMGRKAGHLALSIGIACGAEYVLVPEIPFDRDRLCGELQKQTALGRTNSIIICAEGAADGHELSRYIEDKTGIDMCTTILGYIQRGGSPSAKDSICAALLGEAAVHALLRGCTGHLVGMERQRVKIIPYEEADREKRSLDRKGWELVRRLSGMADESV